MYYMSLVGFGGVVEHTKLNNLWIFPGTLLAVFFF